MPAMRTLFLFLFFALPAEAQWWKLQTSGLDSNLRGVSAAYAPDAKGAPMPAVWACGSNGVILRSTDLGKTWKRLHVAGGDTLDFRGIVAFNATTAYLMSSGEGQKSRIYKTTDGGENWSLQYTDKRKEFFLDSIACLSDTHCFALSDPLNGKFLLLGTEDGQHWNALPDGNMPAALPGEGAFAASNSCLLLSGEEILFGTGGPAARVFHSSDKGRTWTASETPLAHGNTSSGIFSLAIRRNHRIIALGGDYKQPNKSDHAAAYSIDGGKSWRLAAGQPGGFRSAVASNQLSILAVGPNGEEISDDDGVHWKHTDLLNLNALVILDIFNGWAVGPDGTIARFLNHNAAEIRYRSPGGEQRRAACALAD
jgi:photosystem II stability/assembly factor-like uncharacterized protein